MLTRRLIMMLALALLTLTSPGLAGVVGDAEEALQGVPTDGPGSRSLDGTGGPGAATSAIPTSRGQAPSSGQSPPTQGGVSGPGSGGATAGGGVPDAMATPDTATREALQKRQAQNKADTTLSLLGVLFLLALIVAAGVYSKRAGRDD